MAHVNAKCGSGAGGGTIYLDFSALGITDCRVTEYEMSSKDNPIDIPYMAGAKDGSDGTLGLGTLTVSGVLCPTSSYDAIGPYIATALAGKTSFYVWTIYPSGATGPAHHVLKFQSVRVTDVDGWLGERWDVAVTFALLSS